MKTYRTHNFVFFIMLFFQILLIASEILFITKLFSDFGISQVGYVLLGVLLILFFTMFIVHYGRQKICVNGEKITWIKEKWFSENDVKTMHHRLFF